MIILGIDTSCDDTSVAICNDLNIISSNVYSQIKLHEDFGGIVPEEASRAHFSNIDMIVKKTIVDADISIRDIDLITATNGPGLLGALLVGLNYAKGMAISNKIPFYASNHLFSHVYSNFLDREIPQLPAISLVISGGHTLIGILDENMKHKFIGSTLDDAIGEIIDKVGRKLSLPYPAGPIVDSMALKGNTKAFKLPRPLKGRDGYDFSFSGLKTAFLKISDGQKENFNDLFASLFEAISDCLYDRIVKLSKDSQIKTILFSGGVSASQFLRERLGQKLKRVGINAQFPDKKYCTDNAAMVCASGYLEFKNGTFENSKSFLEIDGYSSFI